MIETDVYRNVRNSICAIVVSDTKIWNYKDEEIKPEGFNFHIIGTGFLCRDNLVLTNRHIYRSISQGKSDNTSFLFMGIDENGALRYSLYRINYKIVLTSSPDVESVKDERKIGTDIAFFFIYKDDVGKISKYHTPVTFADKNDIQIGLPIGICGYLYGNNLVGIYGFNFAQGFLNCTPDMSTVSFSPTLVQGHIAGLSPYDNLPDMNINSILTDITNGGGLSGSPVFLTNGAVVGVHTAGHFEEVFAPPKYQGSSPEIKRISTGLGRAAYINDDFISKLLEKINSANIPALSDYNS